MKDRKKIVAFYSKLFKHRFPKGIMELETNSSSMRKTLEHSLALVRGKGWQIHLDMKDLRKNLNPICYVECEIDFRPKGGVFLVVRLKDLIVDRENAEKLSDFHHISRDMPRHGEYVEWLDEE